LLQEATGMSDFRRILAMTFLSVLLVAMCDRADGERPELRHAKAVLAK